MRLWNYTIRFLTLSALAVVISCSEKLEPTPYTYSKVFTGENSKTWETQFFEQTIDGEVVDTYNDACSADDTFTFYANSQRELLVTTGSNKCYAESIEPDEIVDTWGFNNGSATLTMVIPYLDPTISLPMIVREAKSDKMVLEIFLDLENKESIRIHFVSTDED